MTEPSKVIHIRNVGQEITESDLLQLVEPFGSVNKLVMLRTKNQALLQMHDLAAAISMVDYFTTSQPSVRGRNVYMQFSSHQELITDQNQGRKRDMDEEPNHILLVSVHNVLYPMTVDVLNEVFSAYGFVEKIVTFQKSAGFQALIQYETHQSAASAMNALYGRNIYDGCCQLDIQYSNLTELQVNYNNDRSRDFTNPDLPSEQRGRSSQSGYFDAGGMYGLYGAGGAGYQQMGNSASIAAFAGGLPPAVSGMNDRCTVIVSNLNPDKIDEDKLFNLFSLYGNIVRIKLLRSKPDHALVEMSDGFQAELAVHFLKLKQLYQQTGKLIEIPHHKLEDLITVNFVCTHLPCYPVGVLLFGKQLEVNYSKYSSITPSPETRDFHNSNLNRFTRNAAKYYRYCCSPTKMIHLSSIPEDINEDEILDLLEEHGPVVSTKLFEVNGKKQALVLFETEEFATEALVCKHATPICGSIIRISFSQSHNT